MSKISKFIICCIAVIISICSLCVPTYCYNFPPASTYSIELTNNFNFSPNFYNDNNLQYIFVKDIVLFRDTGNVFYCKTSTHINELDNYNNKSISYNDYIYCSVYGEKIEIGKINSIYHYTYDSNNDFWIYLDSYTVSMYENISIPMKYSSLEWRSIYFSVPHCPLDLFDYIDSDINSVHLYRFWNVSFYIDYGGQYYYNNYFGMNFYCQWPLKTAQFTDNAIDFTLSLFDKDNQFYARFFDVNSFYREGFLFNNNFNYMNSYISKVELFYNQGPYMAFGTLSSNYFRDSYYMSSNFYFSSSIAYGSTNNTYTLYSSNSYGQDSLNSSLIPNGSNNFYKTAEWWDIPSHLYNFFIYLIFDAPIISNFTNLVMVIINFIVEVFEFFIGLFNGINNIFFISIFLGIIVLIFLLKIIFKG